MEESSGRPPMGGVARRRRERRLRSMLRHEQQSIRMALATVMHHSFKVHTAYGAPRSQTTATRAREGEVREQHYGLRAQKRPLPGMRPALLVEVQPQGCVERHVVEDPSELAPLVQILDAPVPQMVDTVLEFFRALDLPVDEQVIAVPWISTDRVSQRLVERRLPQMVEQLVHVPTVLSPLLIAEQIVGIPASQRGGNWSLHGPLPGQSSTLSLSRNAFLSGLWSRSPSLLPWNAFLSGLWSRSPSLLLRNAFLSGLWTRSLTFLLVAAWHTGLPHLLVLQMRILLGFFAHFPAG